MKTVEIKCDGCGRGLTATGNSVDYRLALQVEAIPPEGGFVMDVMIYPPVDRYHFCTLKCHSRSARSRPR